MTASTHPAAEAPAAETPGTPPMGLTTAVARAVLTSAASANGLADMVTIFAVD